MDSSSSPVFIPNSEARTLFSKSVDQEYRILIALPVNYAKSDCRYPVLYVLDPDVIFGWVTDLIRAASFLRALGPKATTDSIVNVPDLIVVGIGYPNAVVEQPRLHWGLRCRDLTPTKMSEDKPWGGSTGGASRFLRFVRDELMPFVNSNCRTDPEDSVIVGHSAGGLFALYVLFHEPEAFRRYVVSSPFLWWDHKVTFTYEHEYARKHVDLTAKLFLSAGTLEELDGLHMTSNLKEFARILEKRKYRGFDLKTHIFEDEDHISVIGTAICKGISSVFSESTAKWA